MYLFIKKDTIPVSKKIKKIIQKIVAEYEYYKNKCNFEE